MLQAVQDWHRPDRASSGRSSRPAASGRPRTRSAIWWRCTRWPGPEWLDPYYFRFGASSVLNDLIMQRRTQLAGHYSGPDYVTVD